MKQVHCVCTGKLTWFVMRIKTFNSTCLLSVISFVVLIKNRRGSTDTYKELIIHFHIILFVEKKNRLPGFPLIEQQRSHLENSRGQGLLSYGSRTRPPHVPLSPDSIASALPPLVDPNSKAPVTSTPKGKYSMQTRTSLLVCTCTCHLCFPNLVGLVRKALHVSSESRFYGVKTEIATSFICQQYDF